MEDEMNKYAERFGNTLQIIKRKLAQNFNDLSSNGLTPPQFQILMMVNEKGPCKVTALAELMAVKPSAITVMFDKLVKQGFVSREHQENDRRVVLLSITDKGKQTVKQLKQQSNEIIGKYFNTCSKEEIEKMVLTLEKITSDINLIESGKCDYGNKE